MADGSRTGLHPTLDPIVDRALYQTDGGYRYAVDVADRVMEVVEEAMRARFDPERILARVAHRLVPSREDIFQRQLAERMAMHEAAWGPRLMTELGLP